jgi:hypothetical protein
VIYNLLELQLLRQVVCDQSLGQLVGSDSIQQVELVHPIERFANRDWVEQISLDDLNPFRHLCRCLLFANQRADTRPSFDQLFDYLRPNLAGTASHQNLHRNPPHAYSVLCLRSERAVQFDTFFTAATWKRPKYLWGKFELRGTGKALAFLGTHPVDST